MARKVFISFLGATNYRPCDYKKDDVSYGKERFIQVSTLRYLEREKKWPSDSIGYILLTKGAEESNWVDGGQKDFKTGEVIIDPSTGKPQTGLKTELEKIDLKFPIEVINKLPDGNTEDEIWTIFERTFEKIQDEDELYFDFTHGYRYLPMLVLVLSNYSKFLKNVNVMSITYGNFEVAKDLGYGLIVDLLPLTQLQDWTYAAGQYLDSGNANKLFDLGQNELAPILRESQGKNEEAKNLRLFINNLKTVVDERLTCRGINIIKSDNLKKLKASVENIEGALIKPLSPIIEKIRKSLVYFDELENAKNGYSAAKWCYDNGMYQQSATILQEFVVSFFCMRHSIPIDNEEQREIINQAFVLKYNHKEMETDANWVRVKDFNKPKLREVLADDLFGSMELVNYFNNLTEVRNDFNHSGMRSKRKPQDPKNIKENILKCIYGFGTILFNVNSVKN